MSNVLDQVNNIKVVNSNKPPIPAPPKPAPKKPDALTLLASKLNARRDINKTHAFEFWAAYQPALNDYSAFTGFNPAMHRAILIKLNKFSNFYGEAEPDFTNLTIAEQAYYSDFLGINFKKIIHGIGHGIGFAATKVAHGVRDVTVDVAHGVRNVAVGAAHGVRDVAEDVAHGARSVGKGVGKGVGAVAHDVSRSEKWFHDEHKKFDKWSHDEFKKTLKAVAPYWKVIVAVAVGAIIEIASAGTLTPLAIAATSAILTGLDAIKPPEPPLGIPAGSGGGDAAGGFPEVATGGGGDPANGLTPEQQQAIAQQQQAQAQAQAEYEAAVKKHTKRIMWAIGISIIAIIVAFIIWRHRRKKK